LRQFHPAKSSAFSIETPREFLKKFGGHLILATLNSDKIRSAQLILKPQLVGSFYPKVAVRLL
jgi:hypothetical protein